MGGKAKIVEVAEVVVDVTSDVLEDNDKIYQFKVEDAREEFKSDIAGLEATVSSLQIALAEEQDDLTAALATQQEAKQNKTAAKAYASQVKATLTALKEE